MKIYRLTLCLKKALHSTVIGWIHKGFAQEWRIIAPKYSFIIRLMPNGPSDSTDSGGWLLGAAAPLTLERQS